MDIKIKDIKSVSMKLASPDDILGWSYGEVTKPETINYRTQRAERNGLFDERIFGPEKDYECYCGKYRRIRYKGIICEKCGVEVTKSIVRRERMGHIELAVPVAHIWFMKSIPSRIALLLDIPAASVEKVIYLTGYIITNIDEERKAEAKKQITAEYKLKLKNLATDNEREKLKEATARARAELDSIVQHNVLGEVEYFNLSKKYGDIFDVGIGAESLYNIFKDIDLEMERKELETKIESVGKAEAKHLGRKLDLIKSMHNAGVRPEWMFITVLPIIPPALRPMVALDGGRHATSDVNDLYRRVINRNNRLKRLIEIGAPEVICRNEKRILQEAVDALLDNSIRQGSAASAIGQKRALKSIADMLRGKGGRFRQNLLGKRVDYSGRSVIVVGPDLALDECGLPKHMALELFRPFVISKLIKNELAFNIRGAGRLVEEGIPEVWAILEEVIKNKYVLLNRAPTLHRLGIQAFRPTLIEGKAVQVHPLVCAAFNADFDGDQMAVHVPLSDSAQGEARDIIASTNNLLRPGNGEPIVNPEKEIILGCYWMTQTADGANGEGQYFSSPNEAIMAYDFGEVDLRAVIKVMKTDAYKYSHLIENYGVFETTVGRLLFNSVFPDDFEYINEQLNKGRLSSIVELLIDKYGIKKTSPILDAIKHFGFEYATRSGISWGIDDLKLPNNKPDIIKTARDATVEINDNFSDGLLTEEERYRSFIEIWQHAKDQVEDAVPEALDKKGSVYALVDSKARGSWSQVGQMSGMKGLMLNPSGRVIDFPVVSSYKEGLGVLEYFITTHGARKGEADTALKTAKAGYLTRRLVSVADDVIVLEESCSDEKGIVVTRKDIEEYGKTFRSTVFGRTLSADVGEFKKGHVLTMEDIELLEADRSVSEIHIFSPMTCTAHLGVCQKCYGYDLGYNQMVRVGVPVGVVAAQAIGEPGTQLTLRTFHAGGIATGGDITMGLPRVEELFELRAIKNPAVLCREPGEVISIEHINNTQKIIVLRDTPGASKKKSAKNKESDEYIVPFGRTVTARKGEQLSKGDIMTDGSVDVRDYFQLAGEEKTRKYIMNEIGNVYTMQGAAINDKHLEVIIKKMFSKVKIIDPGDSRFAGNVVLPESDVADENERVLKNKGDKAKAIKVITPISKIPLYSSSFLSAAAFQDTTRVLIKAALAGIEDELKGLRENVIIGNLIPTGTGLKEKTQKESVSG